jgi:hypothetical protein
MQRKAALVGTACLMIYTLHGLPSLQLIWYASALQLSLGCWNKTPGCALQAFAQEKAAPQKQSWTLCPKCAQ